MQLLTPPTALEQLPQLARYFPGAGSAACLLFTQLRLISTRSGAELEDHKGMSSIRTAPDHRLG